MVCDIVCAPAMLRRTPGLGVAARVATGFATEGVVEMSLVGTSSRRVFLRVGLGVAGVGLLSACAPPAPAAKPAETKPAETKPAAPAATTAPAAPAAAAPTTAPAAAAK